MTWLLELSQMKCFWSVFPLVARNADMPTKSNYAEIVLFLYMKSTKPEIIIKHEGIINMLSI